MGATRALVEPADQTEQKLAAGLDDARQWRTAAVVHHLPDRVTEPPGGCLGETQKRDMTTDEIPLLEVTTRYMAWIQVHSGSLVACSGVFVVTVYWRLQSPHSLSPGR